LVEKAEPLKKSIGGIILPENAAEKLNWGTIVEGTNFCIAFYYHRG
jgi:co-chaperonin GroES (HSP10)